jgi:hypothetical protein
MQSWHILKIFSCQNPLNPFLNPHINPPKPYAKTQSHFAKISRIGTSLLGPGSVHLKKATIEMAAPNLTGDQPV